MEDKDLDKLFRDTFIDAKDVPSTTMWAKIENDLQKDVIIKPLPKKNYAWAYAAAAVLLLGLSYIGITLNNRQDVNDMLKNESFVAIDIAKDDSHVPASIDTSILHKQHYDKQPMPKLQDKTIVLKNEKVKRPLKNSLNRDTAHIDLIAENRPILTTLAERNKIEELPHIRQVTEIDDIKPLIENEEEMETMLASTGEQERKHIITSLLNTISEKIDTKRGKELHFYADEEGSFGVNLIQPIAKNRKKRK